MLATGHGLPALSCAACGRYDPAHSRERAEGNPMPVLESQLNPRSAEFQANAAAMRRWWTT